MRYCAQPHCTTLVEKGYCPTHQKTIRGTANQRGYTADWHTFRTITYPALLISQDIPPACGANLSGIPSPHSYCAKAGLIMCPPMTEQDLHLDHEPPLQDWERAHPNIVCDPVRVGYLCASCHSIKTRAEMSLAYG